MVMINGTYKNGRIDLDESPKGIDESRVVVMFPGKPDTAKKMMTFGCARGTTGRESTEEDFKIAEWHGEWELDDEL